ERSQIGGRVEPEKPAERDHADFLAQRLEIGADEAVGGFGDLRQVHVGPERHGARMYPENLQPRLGVRAADLDFAIETAGTAQRWIQDFRNVGRTDDDDLTA